MYKKIFIVAPVALAFGALAGCKGGDSPTPSPTKELIKLEVTTDRTPSSYYIGETFDKANLNVLATWSDGSFNTVKEADYSVSPELPCSLKFEDVGQKTFAVTYLTKSVDVTITVKAKDTCNIDWATKKVDGTNTLYDLARESHKIVIGTNEDYKTTAESLTGLKKYSDIQEIGVKEGSIVAYYGKNSNNEDELYVLCDKKIVFEDNDRYGRDMAEHEQGCGFFDSCTKCKSIILNNIDTSKVTDFSNTFYDCGSLSSINVASFDTSNATDMFQMFAIGVNSMLNSIIGLERFNTEKVTNMRSMFCDAFSSNPNRTLDISSFDTKNLKDARYMFALNHTLTTIFVSQKFDKTNIEDDYEMFKDNLNLIGGAGTKYDSNYVKKEYAQIDEGEQKKGYFTGISSLNWDTDKYSYNLDKLRNLLAKYRVTVLDNHLIDNFSINNSESIAQDIATGWKVYINGADSTELFDYDSQNKKIYLKNESVSPIKPGDVVDFEVKLSTATESAGCVVAW